MCGIFGSTNFSDYRKLYNKNKKRGTFSYGSLFTNKAETIGINRCEGTFDLGKQIIEKEKYNIYLGHTQAPTSCERKWTINTSHPFEYNDWIVAHNGIISNFDEIVGQHFPDHDCKVDSSIIPKLIDYMYGGDEVLAISEACGTLKGTYACWIYNLKTGNIYIVRSGCTLFGDKLTGTFSSVSYRGICTKPLEEGFIYHVSNEGLTSVGGFYSHSPFFVF